MGVQVVYNVKDFKEAASDEKFYEEDGFIFYEDIFLGQRSFFDQNKAWFDNKTLNDAAVQVLDKLKVPYERV